MLYTHSENIYIYFVCFINCLKSNLHIYQFNEILSLNLNKYKQKKKCLYLMDLTNLPYLLSYLMLLCQIYLYINSTFMGHLQ